MGVRVHGFVEVTFDLTFSSGIEFEVEGCFSFSKKNYLLLGD